MVFLSDETDEDARLAFLDANGGQIRDWTVEPMSPAARMPEYGARLVAI